MTIIRKKQRSLRRVEDNGRYFLSHTKYQKITSSVIFFLFRNYTILSIGFEAGFNSKTTFNTVFKKFTQLTPTEYRSKNMWHRKVLPNV